MGASRALAMNTVSLYIGCRPGCLNGSSGIKETMRPSLSRACVSPIDWDEACEEGRLRDVTFYSRTRPAMLARFLRKPTT